MVDFDLKKFEPSEQQYTLTVKIAPHEVSYDDVQSLGSLGNVTRKCLALIPVENSEMYRFFSAWRGIPGKLVEVLIRFDHPFHQYARAAVMWPKSETPKDSDVISTLDCNHLFLMSYGLEQIILSQKHLHGQEIQIVTCAESDDHPDGCPTDGVGTGDELYSGKRREHITGLENRVLPPGQRFLAEPGSLDRHGRKVTTLKG